MSSYKRVECPSCQFVSVFDNPSDGDLWSCPRCDDSGYFVGPKASLGVVTLSMLDMGDDDASRDGVKR